MKYILDFDHTLFDTERFSEAAESCKENGVWVTPAIWDIFDASEFFYKDVIDFLSEHDREDAHLLTAVTPSLGPEATLFQQEKVERSGILNYVKTVTYMEGDKGPYVAELFDGSPALFVDDRADHLQSALEHCPQVVVAQMIRPGLEGLVVINDQNIPVVTSLAELPQLVGE